MRLINNTGTDRVIDVLRQTAQSGASLDIASPALSLFAFFEIRDLLNHVMHSRLILSLDANGDLTLLGSAADRAARNRLQARWLANDCAKWIHEKTEVRASSSLLPQSAYFIRNLDATRCRVITGNCSLTTDGLGLAPGNHLGLIQCVETPEEVKLFANWFESLWNAMPASAKAKEQLLEQIHAMGDHHAASLIYYQALFQLFKAHGDELDEEQIVKSATGIKNTTVWKKLFKFQRDGVVGSIEKLERFGGCIIADSVSQGEAGKMVLDDAVVLCEMSVHDASAAFLRSLSVTSQPRTHLMALYQGWINCMQAFQAAQITGRFVLPTNGEAACVRRDALVEYECLTGRIASLRAQAERESQISRRVDLNMEIKLLQAELTETTKRMG